MKGPRSRVSDVNRDKFVRDSDGVAVLDASQWRFVPDSCEFVHLFSLDVVSAHYATDPSARPFAYGGGGGREKEISPTTTNNVEFAPSTTVPLPRLDAPVLPVFQSASFGLGVVRFPVGLAAEVRTGVVRAARERARRDGTPFNHMGVHVDEASACGAAVASAVGAALRAVHPAASLRLRSAFVVAYPAGAEGHVEHVDKGSDLTINVCLGDTFTGGDMRFSRLGQPSPSIRVAHVVGEAVMHPGSLVHATDEVRSGERCNLVLFCAVDMDPFPFVDLPPDMRRHVMSFLDAHTLARLGRLCRAARAAAEHDALWKDLLPTHPLWGECSADAKVWLEAGRVTAHRVYTALQTLAALRGMGSALKSKRELGIICKETYEMAMRREASALASAENIAWRLIESGGVQRQQRFVSEPAKPPVALGYLPSACLGDWIKPPARAMVQEVKSFPPPPHFRHNDDARVAPQIPRLGLADVLGISRLVAPPMPVQPMGAAAPPATYTDTDGAALEQFPWFWPLTNGSQLHFRAITGYRFIVTMTPHAHPLEFILLMADRETCVSFHLTIADRKVRLVGKREPVLFVERSPKVKLPLPSLQAMADALAKAGVGPLRWPTKPLPK